MANYCYMKNTIAQARIRLKRKRLMSFNGFCNALNRKILDTLTFPAFQLDLINYGNPSGSEVDFVSVDKLNGRLQTKKIRPQAWMSYSMVRNLPVAGKQWLLDFYNKCLRSASCSVEWNRTIICLFSKEMETLRYM